MINIKSINIIISKSQNFDAIDPIFNRKYLFNRHNKFLLRDDILNNMF